MIDETNSPELIFYSHTCGGYPICQKSPFIFLYFLFFQDNLKLQWPFVFNTKFSKFEQNLCSRILYKYLDTVNDRKDNINFWLPKKKDNINFLSFSSFNFNRKVGFICAWCFLVELVFQHLICFSSIIVVHCELSI